MGRNAFMSMNELQFTSLKRDLLLFDKLYFDPFTYQRNLEAFSIIDIVKNFNRINLDPIMADIDYLQKQEVLIPFGPEKLRDVMMNSDKSHLNLSDMHELVNSAVDYEDSFLQRRELLIQVTDLFKNEQYNAAKKLADQIHQQVLESQSHSARTISTSMAKLNIDNRVTPLIHLLRDDPQGKEEKVLYVTINNLPIPETATPMDEIIDFRNDLKYRQHYYGLMNWINQAIRSEKSISEIRDELIYHTLDFEDQLKREKNKYYLSNVEVALKLPVSIPEKILKFKWSEIPNSILQYQFNKIKLSEAEASLSHRELALFSYAKERFG